MSLLSQAKSAPVARLHTASEAEPDMIELAIAYAKHEVTESQVSHALGSSKAKAQSRIRHAIFSAIRTGQLVYKN